MLVGIEMKRLATLKNLLVKSCQSGMLIVLALFSLSPGLADDLRPLFKGPHVPGLPRGIVIKTIKQDPTGFLWFGTETGLYSYDGYNTITYRHKPYDSNTLSANIISYIAPLQNDKLWIGCLNSLVNRLDLTTGEFSHFQHDPNDSASIDNNTLLYAVLGNSGTEWLVTPAGINKLQTALTAEGESVSFFSHPENRLRITQWRNIRSANWQQISARHLWHHEKKLTVFLPSTEIFHQLDFSDVFPKTNQNLPPVDTYFLESGRHKLWVLSRHQLAELDYQSGEIQKWQLDVIFPQLQGITLAVMQVDSRQGVWITASATGLYRLDLTNNELQHFRQDDLEGGVLNSDRVTNLYIDHSQQLWIGSNEGLNLVNLNRPGFEHYKPYPNAPASTSVNRIAAVAEDLAGRIWVSANRKMHRFIPATNEFELDLHLRIFPDSLQNALVKTFLFDNAGNSWFGTLANNILQYSPDGKFQSINLPFPGRHLVRSAQELPDSSILFGVDWEGGGIYHYFPEEKRFATYRHKEGENGTISSNLIWSVYQDRKGRLWGCTWGGGLNLLMPGEKEFHHYRNDPENLASISDNFVTGVTETESGVIWLTTWNGGINQLIDTTLSGGMANPDAYYFQRFTEQDGLPNNVTSGILEDHSGMLWLLNGSGISRYRPLQKRFDNYNLLDGLQSNKFFAGSCLEAQDGKMYFGGTNGFNAFYPDSIRRNVHIPPVVLTAFKVFEQDVALDTIITYKKQLTIPYSHNFFSFEFAALDYTQSSENIYRYQLKGFDKKWVNSGNRRLAIYTDVPPGRYLFQVIGANNDGLWNEAGTTLTLIITPPFWRTGWAYALYLVAFVGLFLSGKWVVTNWRSLINLRARRISRYKLLSLLGKGGMGEVYKAVDTGDSSIVAIKLLSDALLEDPENHRRFHNEGRLLAGFSHPNIVKVLEIGESDKQSYIAMEYLSGGTLKEFLQKNHPLPEVQVQNLLLQIAGGIAEIHRHNIIHRDIKTGNIMLDESEKIRIMDFGLSKSSLVTTMTNLGTVMGTLGYVAPEQITGTRIDHRVDIFSFGVTLYEMLLNKLPFSGENEMALIHAIFNYTPPLLSDLRPDLSSEWHSILKKCLAKNPEQRFQTSEEIIEAIKAIKFQ